MNIYGYQKHLKEMKRARDVYRRNNQGTDLIDMKINDCLGKIKRLKQDKGDKKDKKK